jgi:hypothetical protein
MLILLLLSAAALGEPPRLINYQGIVTDTNGTPLDGTHDLRFRLYAQSAGGDSLWGETHGGVELETGLFNVILGGVNPLSPGLFAAADLWLGVTVNGEPEISPRARLTSVPWALWSTVSDSARVAGSLPGSVYPDVAVRYAHLYPGIDAGEKLAAAIADAQGGIVDARGITGEQYINQNIFAAVDSNLTLILGNAIFNISTMQVIEAVFDHWSTVRVLGHGSGTVLKPTTDMTVIRGNPRWLMIDIQDVYFDLNYSNSTAIHMYQSFRKNRIERVQVNNNGYSATAPVFKIDSPLTIIKDCEIWGLSHSAHGIEITKEGVTVDNVHITGCNAAVHLIGGFPTAVTNSLLSGNVYALLAHTVSETIFEDNNCESNSMGHVRIVGDAAHFPALDVVIKGNHFTGLGSPHTNAIYLENARGIVIEGNNFNAYHPGEPVHGIIFGGNVSDVCLIGNNANGIETTMPGSADVPLPIDDIQATQSSRTGGFAGEAVFGGKVNVGDHINLTPQTTPPSDPSEGDMYMDALTHKLMVYDGTTWRPCW